MEELRSTEILDKEIQEDARRKAERILKNSTLDSQNIIDGVAARLAKVRSEKEAFYADKAETFKRNAEAAIPLEKERFLVSFEDKAIVTAINNYLQNLSADKKIELLEKLLQRYNVVLLNKKIHAFVAGFDIKAIKKLLEKNLGKEAILSCEEATNLDEISEGCILESDDRMVKCRLSLSVLIDEIVDNKRYELASTLFGGRLPQ